MIMKANKQIGFIYKNNESIDKILKDGDVVFERGFLRERTTTTLPITFGGVGKDLKDYRIYGNTHQNSTTGKNLLNYIDKILSSASGLTNVINNDGSITTTGVPTSNYAGITSQYDIIDELEDGQTYTISSKTLNRFIYIQINAVKIAGGTDYIYNSNSRAVQFTVDKSKYSKYNLKIQVGTTSAWGSNSRTITNKYQIEKGATATEFEPYTGGQPSPNPDYPQEIISCGDLITDTTDVNYGKYKIPVNVRSDNLFDVKDYYNSMNGASREEEFIIFNYNNTSSNSKESQYNTNNLKLKTSTMYRCVIEIIEVSGTGKFRPITSWAAQNQGQFTYTIYDDGISFEDLAAGNKIIFNATTKSSFENITRGLRTMCNFSPGEGGYLKVRMSILEDTTITENSFKYQPYYNETTNIYLDEPLRKIEKYSDYIDFVNGKITRQLGEVILDGSETCVRLSTSTQDYYRFAVDLGEKIAIKSNANDVADIFSDKFIGISRDNTNRRIDGIAQSSANRYYKDIVLYYDVVSQYTVEQFKTWLSTHNTIVDYVLATPTQESITLPNIPTIEGNNTLNIETEITPSQVYIKYKSNE